MFDGARWFRDNTEAEGGTAQKPTQTSVAACLRAGRRSEDRGMRGSPLSEQTHGTVVGISDQEEPV